jgi:hypothetical protein
MADDLDAQLSELEDKAPLTIEGEAEDVTDYGPGNPKPEDADVNAKPEDKDAGKADEWKPPTKETYENIQKALRAEREQRRQEAQRARLYEQNISAMEQRIQAWQQQTLAQQLQTPPPDPYESPEQARQRLVQQQNMLQQLHAAEQQRQAQIAQQAHQEQQFQYVAQSVEDYEGEFKAQNPDYDDATDYLLDTQRALLAEAGYPPHVAEQQVAAWSVSVAQQALQANKNPAEWAYAMAKRMGYQPKGTGAKAAAETLAAMQAGQASSKTLSGGGAAAKSGTNLKQIASLEGAAFDSAMEKYLSDAIRGR